MVPSRRPAAAKEREAALTRAGSSGRAVYQLVRGIIDDLEAAAPWSRVYFAPDDEQVFSVMMESLIRVVEGIQQRVQAALADFAGYGAGHEQPASLGHEISGYLANLSAMIQPDLDGLKSRFEASSVADMGATEQDFICELGADLKGKCCSALMGVAGKVVAQGQESVLEVEQVLFPEKQEEFRRNERLVAGLRKVINLIRRLPKEIPFADHAERWLAHRRIDQYALVDLYSLLGAIGELLKESNRRALYSGDYHRIRDREHALNDRVVELSALHRLTWSTTAISEHEEQTIFPRLVQLTLEVVTIIDVDILRRMIGEERYTEVRAAAASEGDAAVEDLSEHLQPLVPLLSDDDLNIFLEMLFGNVLKRASLGSPADLR